MPVPQNLFKALVHRSRSTKTILAQNFYSLKAMGPRVRVQKKETKILNNVSNRLKEQSTQVHGSTGPWPKRKKEKSKYIQ